MPDATWYEKMAAAMKKRERCLNGIAKWQSELAEAEAEIQALRESDVADVSDGDLDANVPADWEQQAAAHAAEAEPAPSI